MFIKGTLDTPKCKFTRRLVENLKPFEYRNLKTFNILEDERIRQWLKSYSNWPTFPQVFVNGEFVGGIDIICELIENDEFDEMIP
jgi:Grx4 family monothiol glutaredoxin